MSFFSEFTPLSEAYNSSIIPSSTWASYNRPLPTLNKYSDILKEIDAKKQYKDIKDDDIERVISESNNSIKTIKEIRTSLAQIKEEIKIDTKTIEDINKNSFNFDEAFNLLHTTLKSPENEARLNEYKQKFIEIKDGLYDMQKNIVANKDANIKKLNEKYEYLSTRLSNMVDNIKEQVLQENIVMSGKCNICIENNIQLAFGCGHTICEGCHTSGALRNCHVCRAPIISTIKLYL